MAQELSLNKQPVITSKVIIIINRECFQHLATDSVESKQQRPQAQLGLRRKQEEEGDLFIGGCLNYYSNYLLQPEVEVLPFRSPRFILGECSIGLCCDVLRTTNTILFLPHYFTSTPLNVSYKELHFLNLPSSPTFVCLSWPCSRSNLPPI